MVIARREEMLPDAREALQGGLEFGHSLPNPTKEMGSLCFCCLFRCDSISFEPLPFSPKVLDILKTRITMSRREWTPRIFFLFVIGRSERYRLPVRGGRRVSFKTGTICEVSEPPNLVLQSERISTRAVRRTLRADESADCSCTAPARARSILKCGCTRISE